MDRRRKVGIAVGIGAGLAAAGGGVAIGATQLGDRKLEDDTIVRDAAGQLGVQPSRLSSALRKALENRVDAAVGSGRLTRAQGDALKQRIESGEVPLFGGPTRRDHGPGGHFGALDAAATYLGLSEDQLRSELTSGTSLADVARAHGKSADGLVAAMVAAAQNHLDEAVASGRITKETEQSILAGLKDSITSLVNGRFPAPAAGGFGFRGQGWGGAPGGAFG